MSALKLYEQLDPLGRRVYLLALHALDELPLDLAQGSRYFVCLLAADTATVGQETMLTFANRLIDLGCAYFSTWGPGCRIASGTFDFARIRRAPSPSPIPIPTMSYADVSLADAIWDLGYIALPDLPEEVLWDECKASIIICVDNDAWASYIDTQLTRLHGFYSDVLNDKPPSL